MVQLGRITLRQVINYTAARDQLHHIVPLVSYLLWDLIQIVGMSAPGQFESVDYNNYSHDSSGVIT